MVKIIVFCDGGARGNPGPAASAFALEIRNSPLGMNFETRNYQKGIYIGTATNNQAEYRAVIEALKYLTENFSGEELEAEFFLDSQLVTEQLNQRYKLKNEGLKPLFWQIRDLVMKLGGKISFAYIRREQNGVADRLVNEAIDKETKRQIDK